LSIKKKKKRKKRDKKKKGGKREERENLYKVCRCLTISRFAVVPNTNTRYETHDAERIMQSESTHVRTGCAKLRKKNARVRPTGNMLRRRARTRERVSYRRFSTALVNRFALEFVILYFSLIWRTKNNSNKKREDNLLDITILSESNAKIF